MTTRCAVCGRFMSMDWPNGFIMMGQNKAGPVCCFNTSSDTGTIRFTAVEVEVRERRRIGFRGLGKEESDEQ